MTPLAAAAASDAAYASRPLVTLLVLGALSLLPFALLMMTSFVKMAVVLSILRSAVGTPQVPPTAVVTGLALLLSLYVMAPTGRAIYREVGPVLERSAGQDLLSGQSAAALLDAGSRAREPVRAFLLRHAHPRDRAMLLAMARKMAEPQDRESITDRDLWVVTPAFVISELTEAFQIGFLLFVPFLVVDMVVASILLALGMHMLSPTTVSLPFKLLLFVLVDGWHLVARGLLEGYAG